MPIFTRSDAEIHYEVHGSGYPLLLFAPGGRHQRLRPGGAHQRRAAVARVVERE